MYKVFNTLNMYKLLHLFSMLTVGMDEQNIDKSVLECDEDELKALCNEEMAQAQRVEEELKNAEVKAKEIQEKRAKEACVKALLETIGQVKHKQEESEVRLHSVRQYITSNGKHLSYFILKTKF